MRMLWWLLRGIDERGRETMLTVKFASFLVATALLAVALLGVGACTVTEESSGSIAISSPSAIAVLSPTPTPHRPNSTIHVAIEAVATNTPQPFPTQQPSPTASPVVVTAVQTPTPTITSTTLPSPAASPTSTVLPERITIVEMEGTSHDVVRTTVIDDNPAPSPRITTIDEEEIASLLASSSRIIRPRSNPVPIDEVLTLSDWSMRVLSVERTEPDGDSECGASEGDACLRIEFEVTNVGERDSIRAVIHDYIFVVGERGIAYTGGGWDVGNCVYRCHRAELGRGERTTIEIKRHVPASEGGFVLLYDEGYDAKSFWLESGSPTRDDSIPSAVATPLAIEIGSAGTWTGNPVSLGSASRVGDVSVRVVEVERGWEPYPYCCDIALPEVLLLSRFGEYVYAESRIGADFELARDDREVDEFDVMTEFLRVRFEVVNVGGFDSKSSFNDADIILVDSDRRVFRGGFLLTQELLSEDDPYRWRAGYLTARDGSKTIEMFGGGTIVGEIVWLAPVDGARLMLMYTPSEHDAGGFLALDDSVTTDEEVVPPAPDWVEDALDKNGTWPSRPAPLGVGVKYRDDIAVRVLDVVRSSRCREWYEEVVQGRECLLVRLEVAVEQGRYRHNLFRTHDDISFLIDGSHIDKASEHSESSYTPIQAEFDSLLDPAEIYGVGSVMVTYWAEVPVDAREAILLFHPFHNTPTVFLSLDDERSIEPTPEYGVDVVATARAASSPDNVGLYEYLEQIHLQPDDIDEQAVEYFAGLIISCASFLTRPSDETATQAVFLAGAVRDSRIGEVAPAYFEHASDPAVFCGKVLPASSRPLVFVLLIGTAQLTCLLGGQGAFGLSSAGAMELGETIFLYWGESAPVSISDFEGPEEFCGWIFDEENDHLKKLIENLDLIDGVNLALFE